MAITYKCDLTGVDWEDMKITLFKDNFHNGRSTEQLKNSFINSYLACIAYVDERIIGTVRVLSDGVCNAYIVDVWVHTEFRRQGVARKMMWILTNNLQGQHVYLFTDDAIDFYKKIGFKEQPTGLSKVIGKWLVN